MAIPLLENTYSIRDKKFNTTHLSQYHLSISIYQDAIKICCVDSTLQVCLLLETYKSGDAYISFLEQIYKINPFLKEDSWGSVTLCICNQQYTLIPPQLFEKEHAIHYAQLAFPTREEDVVRHFTHKQLHVTVVFGINKELLAWFAPIYQSKKFQIIHVASALVEGVAHYVSHKTKQKKPTVFVWIENKTHVHVVIIHKKKITYYNRFDYINNATCTNHILAAIATLSLVPDGYQVIVAGSTQEGRAVHKTITKYIYDVTLKAKNPFLKQRSDFLRIQRPISMAYFDMASTFLCRKCTQVST